MKYIIGGGIAGLICAYYNPEYILITPEVGGQLKSVKNTMITFYLHNNDEIKKLLEELSIDYSVKKIDIFYYYNGKVIKKLSENMKKKFVVNKMIECDDDSNNFLVGDITLSTNDNYLEVLEADVDELMTKLQPKKFVHGKLKVINSQKKIMYVHNDKLELLKYDNIISTIPAPDFFKMLYNYDCSYKFNYLPTTYIVSSSKPEFYHDDSMFYICDPNIPYNRIQKYNDNYIYEVTGILTDEQVAGYFKDVVGVERRYVGLIKSEFVVDLKFIKFVGRMAEWNHSIKTQGVIVKAKRIAGV